MPQNITKLTLAEKRKRVVELKVQGYTLSEIASELGSTVSTVGKWIADELSRVSEDRTDKVKQLQFVQGQRLDQVIKNLWPRVAQGDVQAAAQVIKAEERRAKLYGLDEPARVNVRFDLEGASDPELVSIAARLGLAFVLNAPPVYQLPAKPVVASDDDDVEDAEFEVKEPSDGGSDGGRDAEPAAAGGSDPADRAELPPGESSQ
jgi:transposase-like protein